MSFQKTTTTTTICESFSERFACNNINCVLKYKLLRHEKRPVKTLNSENIELIQFQISISSNQYYSKHIRRLKYEETY